MKKIGCELSSNLAVITIQRHALYANFTNFELSKLNRIKI